MTMAVEQLEVVSSISPTAALGDDMIDFHPILLRKEQSTLRALALLPLQESCDSGRDFRVLPKTGAPIDPIAIIGAAHPMDLHVPTNRGLPMSVQAGCTVGRLKNPAVTRGEAPVPMRDPPFALVGVAVGRPCPQHTIEAVIQALEDTRAANPGVVP